ncbi:MAG TPA: transcriptional regulator NrdR [Acidimicrobiales bacterium]|nr:transcriptional regulator NrdR [Acidimicrobiales bacterium]
MRCPLCLNPDDKVVDSRTAEEGSAIRRRRECLKCGRRFTTFERVEESVVSVEKRGGLRENFDREKIVQGVIAASKNRPVSELQVEVLASEIEELVREEGPVVSSKTIGIAVLERLQAIDEVAYLRFASVYKDFSDIADFEREAGLLSKSSVSKGGRDGETRVS